jgi:hypothetical protein
VRQKIYLFDFPLNQLVLLVFIAVRNFLDRRIILYALRHLVLAGSGRFIRLGCLLRGLRMQSPDTLRADNLDFQ